MNGRAVVLLNPAAGSVAASGASEITDRVSTALALAGVDADVRPIDSRYLAAAVRAAVDGGAAAVVIGGGDGTLNTAVEALVGGPVPLGVLPLGTRNHFARDLGLDGDLDAAARVIAAGHVRQVDVGEVNGRTFLNNCSLGLYADLVRDRETQEAVADRKRWSAIVRATFGSLRRFHVRTVTLRAEGRVWRVTTPMVFVGNNRYETRLLALGRRSGLDEGLLWLYLARNASRAGVFRLAARMMLGRLEQTRDFEAVATTELELRTYRRHVRLAVDGEVLPMVSPLRWRVRPGALRVLAPLAPA
ncbi:MAG TPA: diacylglycerol kinase family protein [Vicinamibacteria bacterium]